MVGFRYEFLTPRRLPERSRHRTAVAALSSVTGSLHDPRVRSCEFPGYALQVALRH